MDNKAALDKLYKRNLVLVARVEQLGSVLPFTKDQLILIMKKLTEDKPRISRLEATARLNREIERLNLVMLENNIPEYRDLGTLPGVPPPRGD